MILYRMLVPYPSVLAMLLRSVFVSSDDGQQPALESNCSFTQEPPFKSRKKIAIIGAGLAGASAAYRINDWARSIPDVDITIFESSSQIGGRIKSVIYRGYTIEVGAASASTHDWCVLKAMRDVGFAPKDPGLDWAWLRKETVGTWNGKKLINAQKHEPQCENWWALVKSVWSDGYHAWLTRKISPPLWWELGKLSWKYGMSPWRMHSVAMIDLGALDKFSSELTLDGYPVPVHSLESELDRVGLKGEALHSAASYFHGLGLSSRFLDEAIEPLVRARFGRDMDAVRGIAAEVSWRDYFSRKVSVQDGNYRLIDRLITLSTAKLKLNSEVREIGHGSSRLYSLLVESTSPEATESISARREEFDVVVIATPFDLHRIDIDASVSAPFNLLNQPISFAERHITHFASSSYLSPKYFNLPVDSALPTHIYTTANSSHYAKISSIREVKHVMYLDMRGCMNTPDTHWSQLDECDTVVERRVYRIISDGATDNNTLEKMVDAKAVRQSAIFLDEVIPYVNRQVWLSVAPPHEISRIGVDKIEIADSLYYTGGMDDVLSSLEMSCRMGNNAASKIHLKLIKERYWDG